MSTERAESNNLINFPPGWRTGQQPGWLRCETSGSNQGGQVEWISKKEGQVRGIESKLYLFCSSQMSRTDLHQPQWVEGRKRGQRRSIRQGWLNILMVVLGHCWGSSYLAISSGWGAGLCQGLIQVFFALMVSLKYFSGIFIIQISRSLEPPLM